MLFPGREEYIVLVEIDTVHLNPPYLERLSIVTIAHDWHLLAEGHVALQKALSSRSLEPKTKLWIRMARPSNLDLQPLG